MWLAVWVYWSMLFCIFCKVSATAIDNMKKDLDSVSIPLMKGLSLCHHVYSNNGFIFYRRLACSCTAPAICQCFDPVCYLPPSEMSCSSLPTSSTAADSIDDLGLPSLPLPLSHQIKSNCPELPKDGDFVVLQLPLSGKCNSQVYYIGYVMGSTPPSGGWRIQCMRRQNNSISEFIFPVIDDICEYQLSDIVQVLQQPKLIRHVHHFSDNLSSFMPNLH